ncbi:uncharacterized conserved protein [Hahella chejuensis KCTC 2396]|uniref:Uncharacterized conserved protein n=1 Tax=Hahella chejuensis (strain KCTC 2396) TaxID=349521 RepID=Q2SQ85_HAHCH|nr:NHL repeat-containing protein [Hahella chejuensis]ABC27189.1 uncharacterized conserved protein [Hahella chejuensis KCTC 2396]
MLLSYRSSLGHTETAATVATPFVLATHPEFTFNSPVGLAVDRHRRIWIADTGNNRLVIMNSYLSEVLAVFGGPGKEPGRFNMPFRLCPHPTKALMYVSDLANRRIQVIAYRKDLQLEVVNVFFGDKQKDPLVGPNGLTFVDGYLCVADEFYANSEGDSRIAIFTEAGEFSHDIQHIDCSGEQLTLLWPQGLSTDEEGRLYIANTGHANVLRCNLQGKGVPFATGGRSELTGLGVARDVTVAHGRLYIPGSGEYQIGVFDREGQPLDSMHGFFAPIQVTAVPGKTNRLLVSDPILATVYLLDPKDLIPGLDTPTFIAQAGNPRSNPGQFYYVTSVAMVDKPRVRPPQVDPASPFWPAQMSAQWWFHYWDACQLWWRSARNVREDPDVGVWMMNAVPRTVLHSDLNEQVETPEQISYAMFAGMLGVDIYQPPHPLPGQVDADAPLLLLGNYLSGFISILQYNPFLNDLTLYAFFGGPGDDPWELSKPMGMAVSPQGDIYIADSGNHRISQWRIDSHGIVGHVRTFGRFGAGPGEFHSPSDVTLDESGRVYVSDQFNNRIQIFKADGTYIGAFGQAGYGDTGDHFLLPTGVHYVNGHLVVNDLVNRALKVFTPDGQFICSYAGLGAEPGTGQLWMPFLLHGAGNFIAVPDCALNVVHLYELDARKPSPVLNGERQVRLQRTPAPLRHRMHPETKAAAEEIREHLLVLASQSEQQQQPELREAHLDRLQEAHARLRAKHPPPTMFL